jgi:hypothetical protein
MENKKVVRLTESDLHRIITEAVKEVLSEGQGWDLFKGAAKDAWSGKDDSYMKDGRENGDSIWGDKDEFKKQNRNFIQYGDAGRDTPYHYYDNDDIDEKERYYNPERPMYSRGKGSIDYLKKRTGMSDKNLKKVDNSLGGKVGRAAGLAGAKMAYHTRDMYNKMRGYYNK